MTWIFLFSLAEFLTTDVEDISMERRGKMADVYAYVYVCDGGAYKNDST